MVRHYGFVADLAKVRMPEHNGKVERALPTMRKHLLARESLCRWESSSEETTAGIADDLFRQFLNHPFDSLGKRFEVVFQNPKHCSASTSK